MVDDTKQHNSVETSENGGGGFDASESERTTVINGIVPGAILADRYEIVDFLGSGGMGAVYKARHNLIGNLLAVKVLHPHLMKDAASQERFKAEAQAAVSMRHERLMTVSDYGISPTGQPFIVMDYLEGKSLAELLQEKKHLAADEFFEIFQQVCEGLAHVHEKGVVHRDIKPSNIMLSMSDNGKWKVHIVDFGIAKVLPRGNGSVQQLTQTGEIFGSPLYMSPEQCKGRNVDARSDIYSLGCVMFEALTGDPPHKGESAIETLMFHVNALAPKLSERRSEIESGGEIEQIVAKALMTDPDVRYQSIEQLKADLMARKFTAHNVAAAGYQAPVSNESAGAPSSPAHNTAVPTTVPELRAKVLKDTFVNPMIIAAVAALTVWLVSSLNIKQPPVATVGGINEEKLHESELEFQLARDKASQGFTQEAAEYSQKALDLRAQLVPGSLILAESLDQRADIAVHDAEHENLLLQQKPSDTTGSASQDDRIRQRREKISADYDLSERLLKQAIAIADAKTSGADKSGAPVRYRKNMTTVYLDQHKYKYAEQTLKEIEALYLDPDAIGKSGPDAQQSAFHDLFDEQYERLYWGTGRDLEAARLRLSHHRPEALGDVRHVNSSEPFTGIWSHGNFSLDLHQTSSRISGQTPALNSETEKPGQEPSAVVGDINGAVAHLTISNSNDVRISAVAVQLDDYLVFHANDLTVSPDTNYVPEDAVLMLESDKLQPANVSKLAPELRSEPQVQKPTDRSDDTADQATASSDDQPASKVSPPPPPKITTPTN